MNVLKNKILQLWTFKNINNNYRSYTFSDHKNKSNKTKIDF